MFFRRPQRTLLPGLGVASAVFAGVLVAVTFAASLMGADLPLGDTQGGPSAALQIEARAEATARAREQARSGVVQAPRRVGITVPAAGDRERESARAQVDAAPALAVEPEAEPAHETRQPPPPPPTVQAASPPSSSPDGSSSSAASGTAASRNPLEPLGSGVNDTTDGVATTLRTLTEDLGDGVRPLSPQLGGVVAKTGDALGDVVEGTGNLLGQVLGRPAGAR
jgi:hypothetical protein